MRDYNLLRGLKGFVRQNLRARCGARESPTASRVCISMQPGIYCKDKRKSRDIIVCTICFNLANQGLFFPSSEKNFFFFCGEEHYLYFHSFTFLRKTAFFNSNKMRN